MYQLQKNCPKLSIGIFLCWFGNSTNFFIQAFPSLCTGPDCSSGDVKCPLVQIVDNSGTSVSEVPGDVSMIMPYPYPYHTNLTPNRDVKCTSGCSSTVGMLYSKDWCWTDQNPFSWDYCYYPADAGWESGNGFKEKHAQLGQLIYSDSGIEITKAIAAGSVVGKYIPEPYPNPILALTESVKTTFDTHWDSLVVGRKKVIHSVGTVCEIEMDMIKDADHKYTGLLSKSDSMYGKVGYLRLGNAVDISDSSQTLVPGAGLKFMRDDVESGNLLFLHRLDGLDSDNWNFFNVGNSASGNHHLTASISNHIESSGDPTKLPLLEKFKQASSDPTKVGISDFCTWDQNDVGFRSESGDAKHMELDSGLHESEPEKLEKEINFPFQLTLVPTSHAAKIFDPNYPTPTTKIPDVETLLQHLERFSLANVGVNNPIYLLYAKADASEETTAIPIATISLLKSGHGCQRSEYGDKSLNFRHQLIEEDWKLRPDFKPE